MTKHLKRVLALCLLLTLPALIQAAEPPDSNPGTSTEALSALIQAAEAGDLQARFELGNRYLNGNGVLQNSTEALRWLTLAAEQGSRNAQYNVAVIYLNGVGIEPDAAKAVEWFRKAADNGDPPSQFALAVLLFEGLPELPQDIAQSYKWFVLAGASGDQTAAANAVLVQEMLAPDIVQTMQAEAQQWIEDFNARRATSTQTAP
jgi:TPR repeat protein